MCSKHRNCWGGLVALTLLAFVASPQLCADGGSVQFRQQTGSIVVTLFGSPSPLRTGPADLSVLLETAGGNQPVLDADVSLTLRQGETHLTAAATHAQATNKLLYAALPDLPTPGQWQVTVMVERAGTHSEVGGTINILPGPPAILFYWPYFLVVPVAIGLFALNQWLKKKEAGRRRTNAPPKHYHWS
ncbi:MAG TPA: hypothetical protein VN633_03135 [Bryobacteraceae bacterium]|nr:hypothetical protein [Bryobacteraceae bacterium]